MKIFYCVRTRFTLFLSFIVFFLVMPFQARGEDECSFGPQPRIDELVIRGIEEGKIPGAVVIVGNRERILYAKSYGNRQVKPVPEVMTLDSIFDLASISKVVSTAIGVHLLADRGMIDLEGAITSYLPEFGKNGKEKITILDCLTHTSGLIADNSLRDYVGSQEEIWGKICSLKLSYPTGTRFVYSDVGFIVLGKLIERISGMTLDEFAAQNIFRPLGMNDTGYALSEKFHSRCVPTEKRSRADTEWIRGEVHDPRAFAMRGVAGHAGVFSTGRDLAILGTVLLNRGTFKGTSKGGEVQDFILLSSKAFERMTQDRKVPGEAKLYPGPNIRSAGWDKRSVYSRNRARNMSESAFGHGGFTGSAFWVDPEKNIYVIFLASRLHPDGKGNSLQLSGDIGTSALEIFDGK